MQRVSNGQGAAGAAMECYSPAGIYYVAECLLAKPVPQTNAFTQCVVPSSSGPQDPAVFDL